MQLCLNVIILLLLELVLKPLHEAWEHVRALLDGGLHLLGLHFHLNAALVYPEHFVDMLSSAGISSFFVRRKDT